jgi:excisionase family DNA binding protein
MKQQEPVASPLLTIPEAAAYLNVSVETLKYWLYRTVQIPSVRLGPRGRRGLRRLRKQDLDAYIEAGVQPAHRLRIVGTAAVR